MKLIKSSSAICIPNGMQATRIGEANFGWVFHLNEVLLVHGISCNFIPVGRLIDDLNLLGDFPTENMSHRGPHRERWMIGVGELLSSTCGTLVSCMQNNTG